MERRTSLKYFVSYCLWKFGFDFDSRHTSSKLISLTFLVTARHLTMFEPIIRAIKWQESPKTSLIW